MFKLISVLILVSSAQDINQTFLKNINNKSHKEKILALEKRIDYGASANNALIAPRIIDYYLDLEPKNERYLYIFQSASKVKDRQVMTTIASQLASRCIKDHCLELIDQLEKKASEDMFTSFIDHLSLSLTYEHFASIEPFHNKIKDKIFKLSSRTDVNHPRFISFFTRFGDYKSARKYFNDANKKGVHPITIQFHKCVLKTFLDNLKEARACFSKVDAPVSINFVYYIKYLETGILKKNLDELNKSVKIGLKTDNPRANIFALILKLLYTDKVSDNERDKIKQYALDHDDILHRFSLIYLVRSRNILPQKTISVILDKFNKDYPGHYLNEIISGRSSNKLILNRLGERSLAYQATLVKPE